MALLDRINELVGFGLRWYRRVMMYRVREEIALGMHRAAKEAKPKLQSATVGLTLFMAVVASLAVNALAMVGGGVAWLLALLFEDAGPWIAAGLLIVVGLFLAVLALLLIFIAAALGARMMQRSVDEMALRIHPEGGQV